MPKLGTVCVGLLEQESIYIMYLDVRARYLENILTSWNQPIERQGIGFNYPLEIYKNILESDVPLKVVKATLAGSVLGIAWILYYKNDCYFWDGASNYSFIKIPFNNLIQSEVIKWACKNGFQLYDMIGSGGRGGARDGIARFKLSMGAEPRKYFIVYYMKWWIRILLKVYRWFLKRKDKPTVDI